MPRQFRYRKKPDEVVELFWQEGDALTIQATKAIYLLRRRRTREILYIGKASRQSVGRLALPVEGTLTQVGAEGARPDVSPRRRATHLATYHAPV